MVPLVPHDAQQVSHAAEVVLAVPAGVFRQLGVETNVPRPPNDLVGPRLHHQEKRRLDGVLSERGISGHDKKEKCEKERGLSRKHVSVVGGGVGGGWGAPAPQATLYP